MKRESLALAVSLALAAMSVQPAQADTWNCINSSWEVGSCWLDGTVPTAADNVFADPVGATNTSLTFNYGTASANSLMINSSTANTIGFLQTGGSLSAGSESIGVSGTGTFTQSGGLHTVTNALDLGKWWGSSGSYNLSGSSGLSAGREYIGFYGNGAFTQSGGTHTVTNTLYLGYLSGSNGSYTLNSGSLSANQEYIDYYGTGAFIQSGGTNTTYGLLIGNMGSGNGSYTLNSGSLSVSIENIGDGGGNGTFIQNGGTHMVNGLLIALSGNGSYTLNSGSLSAGSEYIGIVGTGTFTQSGGTHTLTDLFLGHNNGGNGSYTLNSGSLSASSETIGGDGFATGAFTQVGGTHTVTGTMTIAANPGSSGSYNLQGGLLRAGAIDMGAGTAAFNFAGGTLSVGQFTGNLVNNGGTLAPGSSPGTTNITGDYTQAALGIYSVEIGGLLAGTQYDVLNVSGTAFLDGLLKISLFDLGGGSLFMPHAGDTFDIFTADVLFGSFSSLSFATLSDPNLFWRIDYLTDAIGTTDVVRLSVGQNVVPPPVPEPETYVMLLAGLGFLGFTARRRRQYPV